MNYQKSSMKNRDLKALRKSAGFSQNQFATLLGVSQPALSNAESKPERVISNRLYYLVKTKTRLLDQTNDSNISENDGTLELTIKLKSADIRRLSSGKKTIDLSTLFTEL